MKQLYVMTTPLKLDPVAIPDCVSRQLQALQAEVEKFELSQVIDGRTKGFQKTLFDAQLDRIGIQWGKTSAIEPESSMRGKSITNFDGVGICDESCSSRHKINYVLCLNNREATGTNFLKLELGVRNDSDTLSSEHVYGVLVCLSRSLLERGGWDSSYADCVEYENAYKSAYASVLNAKSLIFEIHAP